LSGAADERILPFRPGEVLTYDLRWKFINAGSAVFTVQPMEELNDVPAYHFALTVNSSPFLDLFYKVRDRVDSYADSEMTRSLLYKNEQREGDYSRDVIVTFDWENETAQFENRGEKLDPIFVHPGTFDPLSISYYLRMQELVPGKELMAPVTDGKRCVVGRVRVVEEQEVKVPAGRFETLLVEPVVGHLGGVFKRSRTSSVQIWITSDPQHIPVKVSGKAKLGSFSAVLVSVQFISR
jgi:Protein of unknown function (DUF3108)